MRRDTYDTVQGSQTQCHKLKKVNLRQSWFVLMMGNWEFRILCVTVPGTVCGFSTAWAEFSKKRSITWKVRQNEWNRHRSENARRPKAKTSPTRCRLARNCTCRRERNFHDVCKDIWWQKTNWLMTKIWLLNLLTEEDLLTTKIFWQNLLTKTISADKKLLLTQLA